MTLWHTSLYVSDVDRTVEFYRDTFGYEVVREFESSDGTPNVFVGVPDSDARDDAAVQLKPADGPVDPGDFDHVALEVEDIEATLDRFDDEQIDGGPMAASGGDLRIAFVEDPDGYGIELIEDVSE